MRLLQTLILITLGVFLCSHADALCVKSSKANLRSGPGTRYKKVWEVYRYMPLRRLKRRKQWYKVKDFEGESSWVHSKLITSRYRCAVVKVNTVNLRTGPGKRYRKAGSAERYYTFRVLKQTGAWLKLKDEYNDVFWAYRKLLWVN